MMREQDLILSRNDISRRVKELGRAITGDYEGSRLMVVGVLKGAFIFMADLIREIDLPLEVDFIRLASYGENTFSCGAITLNMEMELGVYGRDVLIVEDIADTGRTLACLVKMLQARGASSVRVCALLDKKERREVDITLDYAGFEVDKGFLVGYGLDCAEQYRHLPQIYRLQS